MWNPHQDISPLVLNPIPKSPQRPHQDEGSITSLAAYHRYRAAFMQRLITRYLRPSPRISFSAHKEQQPIRSTRNTFQTNNLRSAFAQPVHQPSPGLKSTKTMDAPAPSRSTMESIKTHPRYQLRLHALLTIALGAILNIIALIAGVIDWRQDPVVNVIAFAILVVRDYLPIYLPYSFHCRTERDSDSAIVYVIFRVPDARSALVSR